MPSPRLRPCSTPGGRFHLLSALRAGGAVLAGLLAGGCSSDASTSAGATGKILQELHGDAARVTATTALPNSATSDGWDFAWKFYVAEAHPDQNVFFSPYSISTAFAMLVGGATGDTQTQIQQTFDFSTKGDAFDRTQNDVLQALAARNHPASEARPAQALQVSNGIWLLPSFKPQASFLNRLSAYYGTSAFLARFDKDPEGARQAINQKIANDTQQLIPELLPQDSVNGAVFVLTNALYFKSQWATPFSATSTSDGPFHAQNGSTVDVPLMHGSLGAEYIAGSGYQALVLPYAGQELELVAIMPTAGSFDDFLADLSADSIAAETSQTARTQMNLTFPKLELEYQVDLTARLQALGMQTAFSDGADFSGIGPGIALSGAFHQATLSVDENGTEAAAATAIAAVETSAPLNPLVVQFDHPFVFFIRDIESHALLFAGQYVNP